MRRSAGLKPWTKGEPALKALTTAELFKEYSDLLEFARKLGPERDELGRQRNDLLAVLFQPYDTRKHLAEAIFAGDPDAKQIPSSRQAGQSQGG